MITLSAALATALDAEGVPVFAGGEGFTKSHQFAVLAAEFGVGQAAPRTLRNRGFLACGIGLPVGAVNGDMNGLRLGTPELVRWRVTVSDADRLAKLIRRGLRRDDIAVEVADWRKAFNKVGFVHD